MSERESESERERERREKANVLKRRGCGDRTSKIKISEGEKIG